MTGHSRQDLAEWSDQTAGSNPSPIPAAVLLPLPARLVLWLGGHGPTLGGNQPLRVLVVGLLLRGPWRALACQN